MLVENILKRLDETGQASIFLDPLNLVGLFSPRAFILSWPWGP